MNITENYIGSYPYVKIEGVDHLDIGKIFDCGQCFRFDAVEDSAHEKEFSGVAFSRFVSFAQDGDLLYIYGSTREDFESVWSAYLGLELDYAEVARDVLCHYESDTLSAAVEYGRGIRILAQAAFGVKTTAMGRSSRKSKKTMETVLNITRKDGGMANEW